jgi:sugar phosphate permease
MFIFTGLGALIWLPGWIWLAPRGRYTREASEPDIPFSQLPWGQVLSTPAFWAISVGIFLSSYYWYFLLTWVPTYLISARGFSTVEMGRVLSIPLFVMAGLNVVAGIVADRLAKKRNAVFEVRLWFCAMGYLASGIILLLLVLPQREAVLGVLLVSVVATGIGNSNYWALSQHVAPASLVGRAIGYLNTIAQIAGATAPLITGWTLGPQKQFGLALTIAGVAPIVASACLLYAGVRGLERMRQALATAVPTTPLAG